MELDLGRIDERETFSFHEQFPLPSQDGGTVECDADIRGEVVKTGDRLLLDAEITCGIRVTCSRCLGEFTLPLKTGFRIVFHRGERIQVPDDAEADDFIILSDVAGGRYDIFPRIKEAILLELPIKFLCSKDCKGLCSRCGADLNKGDCECTGRDDDPRWAPLKNLLKKKENS